MIAKVIAVEMDNSRLINLIDAVMSPDLAPLVAQLRGVMQADMRGMLLGGYDRDGASTAPIKESTIERGRGGDGPARAPRGEGSRPVAGYVVEDEPDGDGYLLTGHWPGVDFVKYLARGNSHMAARNMLGISPAGMDLVRQEMDDFVSMLIGGAA